MADISDPLRMATVCLRADGSSAESLQSAARTSFVYSDVPASDEQAGFGLWDQIDIGSEDKTVILWGRTPADPTTRPVDATEHLGPVELCWVLYRRWQAAQDGTKHNRPPQFLILDTGLETTPRSPAHAYVRSFTERTDSWMRVFTLDELPNYVTALESELAAHFQVPQPDVLQAIIAHQLHSAESGARLPSHHEISNLLGPMLLSPHRGREVLSGHRRALWHLLEALDGISQCRTASNGAASHVTGLKERYERLKVVLIDDMARLGWSDVITDLIGRPVETISDPDDILIFAERCIEPTEDANQEDVLLLDLRLLAGRAVSERIKFFTGLLGFARTKVLSRATRGAVRNELREDLEALATWLSLHAPGSEPASTLALLPRLFAILRPELPIVLFSSTNKRSVLDRLVRFPTILSGFRKPGVVLGGDGADQAIERLVETLDHASRLAGVGHFCARLRSKDPCPRHTWNERCRHFEVYIDESFVEREQPKKLIVSGLVVGYGSADEPAQFSQELESEGLVWGFDRDSPWQSSRPTRWLRKRPERTEVVARIAEMAGRRGMQLGVCRLTRPDPGLMAAQAVYQKPDYEYRRVLKTLMEVLYFDWGPAGGLGSAAEVSFHAATRVVVVVNEAAAKRLILLSRKFGLGLAMQDSRGPAWRVLDKNDLVRLHQRHREVNTGDEEAGFLRDGRTLVLGTLRSQCERLRIGHVIHGKLQGYSLSSEDLFALMGEACADRGRAWPPNFGELKGAMLLYYDKSVANPGLHGLLSPHSLPRQLHYLSDWTATIPFDALPDEMRQLSTEDAADGDFFKALDAARAAAGVGSEIDAIAILGELQWQKRCAERSAIPMIARSAAAAAQRVQPEHLLQLSRLRLAWSSAANW